MGLIMLAKKFRLPIQDFTKERGTGVKTPYFLLKIFKKEATKEAFSRFGVVIGGKVSKKATERNKIRRVILDFFRAHRENFPIAEYLLIVHPSVNNLKKEQIIFELSKLIANR